MRFTVKRIDIAYTRLMQHLSQGFTTEEPLKKVNELAKGNRCMNKLRSPFLRCSMIEVVVEENLVFDNFRVTF